MNWRFVSGMVAALSVAGCEVLTSTGTVTSPGGTSAPDPTATIPASTVFGSPPPAPNGWAGRSAGKGKVLECGGKDPEATFFAFMVGAGRNASVVNGVITFTSVYGFGENEEVSFPVRRPANYMDDPRCVGPDGTGGMWMSVPAAEGFSFFILPGRSRGVQVNQLLPPKR